MAYTPREIKDRVAVGDDIFQVEDLGNNQIRLIPAPTYVSEPGTPVNKALLQPMENHMADFANPHATTKAQVGLGNVDNVKQASKSELDAHVGAGGTAHAAATSAAAGFMSAADKALLDQMAAGGGEYAPASHVGAGGTAHATATTSAAGFMSAADKVKLNGVSVTDYAQSVTTINKKRAGYATYAP